MKKANLLTDAAKSRERGGILIVATLVIVVMLIVAVPFLFKLSAGYRSTERGAKALAALNLAEAGVDKVVWDINRDWTANPPYDPSADLEHIVWAPDLQSGTIENVKAPDNAAAGHVAFTLTPDPTPGTMLPGTRVLESTGMAPFIAANTVNRTVRVALEKYFDSIWDYGFVVDQHFRITNTQLTVDSYDSRVANYDPNNVGDSGYFACLNGDPNSFIVDQGGGGTITVTGALAAGGNAYLDTDPTNDPTEASADSAIDLPKQVDDSVTQIAMTQPFDLPPVNLLSLAGRPTWPDQGSIASWFTGVTDGTQIPASAQVINKKSLTAPISGTQTFHASDSGVYTSFELAPASVLNIAAGEHVTLLVTGYSDGADGKFIMGAGSSIRMEDGATLTLILGKTSCYLGQMTSINVPLVGTVDEPGTPADTVILGMQDFTPGQAFLDALTQGGDLTQKMGLSIQKDPATSPVGVVVFEQQSDISAAIYTPCAEVFDIQGMNHADIYGAWITKTMTFKVAARFHYDEALGELMDMKGGPPKWRIINWVEIVN